QQHAGDLTRRGREPGGRNGLGELLELEPILILQGDLGPPRDARQGRPPSRRLQPLGQLLTYRQKRQGREDRIEPDTRWLSAQRFRDLFRLETRLRGAGVPEPALGWSRIAKPFGHTHLSSHPASKLRIR